MRKIRRLAAAVTALALTGSILACSGVSGQMRDAQVRETTIIGDVSAAAGITIRFGSSRDPIGYGRNRAPWPLACVVVMAVPFH